MSRIANGHPADKAQGSAPPPPPAWRQYLIPIGLALTGLLFLLPLFAGPSRLNLTYSQFLADLNAGRLASVTIGPGGQAIGTLKDGSEYLTTIPLSLAGRPLLTELQAKGVQIAASPPAPSLADQMLHAFLSLLPL